MGRGDGEEVRRFEGLANLVHSVWFSPDGRFLITENGVFDAMVGSIGSGGIVLGSSQLWDLTTGQQARNLSGGLLDMTCAAYSPDGRFILTGRWEIAQLWDAATGQEERRFARHSSWVRAVAFSSDGRFVLTGSADNTARLWDAATGQELRRFIGHSKGVSDVAFSPDSRFVATASYDRTVRLWDAETGKEIRRIDGSPPLAFSPDGHVLITDSAFGPVMWETATGKDWIRLIKQSLSYNDENVILGHHPEISN